MGKEDAQVVFKVECRETGFGDQLAVVGSHGALGSWDSKKAAVLSTTQETFPIWSTKQLMLPVDDTVEFKFVIIKKVVAGKPGVDAWESFDGNRRLVPKADMRSVAMCHWSKRDPTWVEVIDIPKLTGSPAGSPRGGPQISEGAFETMKERLDLADAINAREPMKKNFSQSMMQILDDEEDGPPEEQPKVVRANSSTVGRKSANMKNIASFTALSEMFDAAEKEEARATQKYAPSYTPKNLHVPIVICTSEIAPYSKTGGLGLVAASYAFEFPRKGHRTMAVAPMYKNYEGTTCVGEAKVYVNGTHETVKYFHKHQDGCDFVFVDHPAINKGKAGLYNDDDGREYPDNLFRFTLLSNAAMEAPLILRLNGKEPFGQDVMFLANDWQAGLIPLYLCYKYRPNKVYAKARVCYVVHNLGYQGQYPNIEACHYFGVPPNAALDLKYDKTINLSKGALICCDRLVTVSENYCKEIQTASGGFRLEETVRGKAAACRLEGILNGIDDCWNPSIDTHIARMFDVPTFVAGKAFNKQVCQQELGLTVNDKVVLIGFIGRLTWQKGIDVLCSIVDWLMKDEGNGVTGRIQLIMMGNGEKTYGDQLLVAESKYPGRVCGYRGFDPRIEHQMMAGCDLFLMPSRYEPCGLPQMYSQRYGTLPIVTATGGLVDSVVDVSAGIDKATGFHMAHPDVNKMKEVVYAAAKLYLEKPDSFRRMQETAMKQDFYWPQAMDKYERCIDQTLAEACISRA